MNASVRTDLTTILDPKLVAETADLLARRVNERFKNSGLGNISTDVAVCARGAEELSRDLSKPKWLWCAHVKD